MALIETDFFLGEALMPDHKTRIGSGLAGTRELSGLSAIVLAAGFAAEIAREYFVKSPEELAIETKGDGTKLTVADTKIQKTIIEQINSDLKRSFEDAGFLAEEKGGKIYPKGNSNDVFVIDPIDGTANFASGNPCYAINLGYTQRQEDGTLKTIATVTALPELHQYVISSETAGSFLFDAQRQTIRHLRFPETKLDADQPLKGKTINIWADQKHAVDGAILTDIQSRINAAGGEVQIIRSCAQAISRCATGEFDGVILVSNFSAYAFPWDVVGAHQIEKAGGTVTALDGYPDVLNRKPPNASSPLARGLITGKSTELHGVLQEIFESAFADTHYRILRQPKGYKTQLHLAMGGQAGSVLPMQ